MRSLLALFALLAGTVPALAGATPETVKQRIEKAYPVQVLRVDPTEVDGRPALAVRVMNKASGQNGGFGVTTLVVDAETGELVPAFRHRVSGYTLPDQVSGDPRQVNVPERGSTWR
jgi:hypothetical protein